MAAAPDDKYEIYFAEKLWEMIPAFYRDEDGLAEENPGVLRALVEVLAEQAAHLRRSQDSLWDDQFIDLCDDWAVAYIADLVGARLVSALNSRGRRADVAKTIYYRRRKGTVRVLEELISDITGWEGVVVEEFRRLARTHHALDPKPRPLAGRFTGTPPGGWADLRRPRGAELADGPFDEFFHSADVRRPRGADGRYGIHKLAFHLYRLPSRRLTGVVPMPGATDQMYTFDPSGRDVPLFARRRRGEQPDWEAWRSAAEWELPAPIRCRVLGHSEYVVTETLVQRLVGSPGMSAAAAAALRKLREILFRSEADLRHALGLLAAPELLPPGPLYPALLRGALTQDCGRSNLLTSYEPPGSSLPKSLRVETPPGTEVPSDLIVAGNLSDWSAAAADKRLVIDPERGRLLFLGAPPAQVRVDYHYGFSADIGAGSYDRGLDLKPSVAPALLDGAPITAADINPGTPAAEGVTQIGDSSTFPSVADKSGIRNAVIQAANFQRPYLRLGGSWTLDTGANGESLLTLEGLWVGATGNFSLVLAGDYERVLIRHCTLDPGGTDAQGNPIPALRLTVAGNVELLVVEESIIGPVQVGAGGALGKLVVRDSVVHSIDPAVAAVALPASEAELRRATVFGALDVNRLDASEALVVGLADVTDTQSGCFRFSAALVGSRVPHPFASHFFADAGHHFTSRVFGQPGYAQLSLNAPEYLLTGAENGSEIGVFSRLLNPIRLDGLRAKVDEFMPFGLIPVFVFET